MLLLRMILNCLVWMVNLHVKTGLASVFGYRGDKQAGGNAFCLKRPLNNNDVGVAHRTLKCGTKILLFNPRTLKTIIARVLDHGPYGSLYKGHWVLKRHETDRGTYRGELDLSPRASKLLGHNGFEEITYWVAQ